MLAPTPRRHFEKAIGGGAPLGDNLLTPRLKTSKMVTDVEGRRAAKLRSNRCNSVPA
jgi:hypothetical protein